MITAEKMYDLALRGKKDNFISRDAAIALMKAFADQEPEERKPEFEYCGHCGAENCRNNEICIKCNKLRTWIP